MHSTGKDHRKKLGSQSANARCWRVHSWVFLEQRRFGDVLHSECGARLVDRIRVSSRGSVTSRNVSFPLPYEAYYPETEPPENFLEKSSFRESVSHLIPQLPEIRPFRIGASRKVTSRIPYSRWRRPHASFKTAQSLRRSAADVFLFRAAPEWTHLSRQKMSRGGKFSLILKKKPVGLGETSAKRINRRFRTTVGEVYD